MKNGKKPSKYEVPEFDETILNPVGTEVVRAVRTMPNQEFVFEKYCRREGIAFYLPVCRAIKVHNVTRRGKNYSYSAEVLRPLFTSYAFVKMPEMLLHTLHNSNVVARILPLHYTQEQFLDEIKLVRICETLGFEQELEVHKEIQEGDSFLIESGIWEGVRGELSHRDGVDKWTVKIDFCGQYVTTLIDPKQFKMVPLEN